MTIEPKKAKARADHRRAKHRQLPRSDHVRDLQVFCRHCVCGKVSDEQKHTRHDDGTADRKTVESVGQVHRIRAAHDGEHGDDNSQTALLATGYL
jgi:hypothetical protein